MQNLILSKDIYILERLIQNHFYCIQEVFYISFYIFQYFKQFFIDYK